MIERLGHPRVIALTATAAPPVRADIAERLGLHEHREVIASFDRSNLHLAVRRFTGDADKRRSVITAEKQPDRDGQFPLSSSVHHAEWDHDAVMSAEQDRLTVLFDEVGYKTLSLRAVHERGLVTLDEASERTSSGTRKGEHDIT